MVKDSKEKFNFLEKVIVKLPGLIYYKDLNGVYLGCNEAQAKIIGLSTPDEVIGKTDFDILSKEEASKLWHIDQQVMSGEILIDENTPIEETITLPDGHTAIFESVKTPIFNNSGKTIGLLGVSINITKRKKMESELKIAKEKAEAAKYIMTEFISNMGHDIATPISDVGGIAEILNCYADEYPELKEFFKTLVERAEACNKVRKSIINATSIANLNIKPETFSIVQELLALETKFRPSAESKDLKFIIHPPKPKKQDQIETDRSKFHEILVDLISNAINFTEQGQVTISVLKKKDFFHIQVIDTGIGIPNDKFEYIFEQYTKLSRSNTHGATFKGVGAGLYLARLRANILGATIGVKSKLNKGSTFTLSIPAQPRKS